MDCEYIRSVTGWPTQSLGIKNRGLRKAGYTADICVLDYPNARAASDYLHPFRKTKGYRMSLKTGRAWDIISAG